MKSLRSLVVLALVCPGGGQPLAQPRPPANVNLSPEAWPKAELEKYWQLQRSYLEPHPGAQSSQGMVAVSSDALAARVGLEALQQGGSAADAALASALAQVALTAGSTISYAGVLTLVYYDAASQKVYSLNAGYNTVQAEKDPGSIPRMGRHSGRSALVPGFFAGVQAAHDRFGKLPFSSLFEPAIYLAERGFVVDAVMGGRIRSHQKVLTRLPETRRVFTGQRGELYQQGDLFKQPQLAGTLRRVATEGAAYIYQGEWAKRFVAAVRREGGKVTLEDMTAYRAIWSEPMQTDHHGYQVYSLGLPSSGGVDTIEALNLLEVADLKHQGHYTTSPEALYEFIQICRARFYLTAFPPKLFKAYVPEVALAPADRASKESARRLWQKMHEPAWRQMLSAVKPKGKGSHHTAGVVAVDAPGNVAALVHTINAIGWGATGIFVDGISVPDSASFQQAEIAKLKPGDRLPDTTNPVIVLKDGRPYLASSSLGSALHPTTLNNLVNVLDFDMDLEKSMATPNFMGPFFGIDPSGGPVTPQWDKEAVMEGDFSAKVLAGVEAKGQAVKLLSKSEAAIQRGYWVAIRLDPQTGQRSGAVPFGPNGCVAGY